MSDRTAYASNAPVEIPPGYLNIMGYVDESE
ncbi:MAG TPA: radical SAM protein, partial [Oscillatoriales cyanobacterium M59_W2019_021]